MFFDNKRRQISDKGTGTVETSKSLLFHFSICGLLLLVMLAPCSMVSQTGVSNSLRTPIGPSFQQNIIAAQAGNPDAQLKTGKAFFAGNGVARNNAAAVQWFRAASDQGSAEATAWLGQAYLEGRGVHMDKAQGLKLIRQAADSNDRVGLRMMGEAYVSGNGVNRDYAKAAGFLSQAVQQGEPDSYHLLARLYWKGLGVKSDLPKSLDLLKQGTALGDSWAQYYLGQYYEYSGNETLAFKLYLDSANQGNRKAAYLVGLRYAEGKGLEKDHAKAFTYFKVSASKGETLAQRELAWASEFGLGTAVNLVTAYYWYSLAKANNDQFSTNRLPLLMAKMNQDDVRAGEAAVAGWEQRRAQRFQGQ
jgi:hypothetical protein